MECRACKANVPDGSRFCNECGASSAILCAACGIANPPSAKFCSDCGRSLTQAPTPTVTATAASAAERRQLTVMFCDIIGSTELSSRLDPEDLSALIRTYQKRVAESVLQFGGFIARYVGDGVLVYFGWPRASETDAEQAVRAALAATEFVAATPIQGEALRVRIGIAGGLVVIGDPIGADDFTSADRDWRDAKPRRTAAGAGGARQDCHRRRDAQSGRQLVRLPRSGSHLAQRLAPTGAGV